MATVAANSTAVAAAGNKTPKQMQQLIDQFNTMRQEQRQLSNKLADIEGDLNEHRLVIEALNGVQEDRKCFRMIGGVLIEHKVRDVLPDLRQTHEMLQKTIDSYQERVQQKAGEINEYVKTNNLVGLLRANAGAAGGGGDDAQSGGGDSKADDGKAKPASATSVLV